METLKVKVTRLELDVESMSLNFVRLWMYENANDTHGYVFAVNGRGQKPELVQQALSVSGALWRDGEAFVQVRGREIVGFSG